MGSGTRVPTKWRSTLTSPYTISSSELSDEEDTVSHRSSPSIDCESKEEDSEQESSDTESGPEARKQEDSKGARKKKTDLKWTVALAAVAVWRLKSSSAKQISSDRDLPLSFCPPFWMGWYRWMEGLF